MSNIPVIDIIFFVLIILMVIHGLIKGFIGELFSWAPLVLAVCTAIFLYPAGADLIRKRALQGIKFIPELLAFIAVFVAVILVLKLLEHVLKDIVDGAMLGGIDKILGMLFGFLEGVALTTAILLALNILPVTSKVLEDSFFAQFLLPLISIPINRGKEVIDTVFLFIPGVGASV